MLKAIFGKKIRMTKFFDENGLEVPVTAVQAGPCPVVQVKTEASDGYRAIQIGFDASKRKKSVNKPQGGHFEKASVEPTRYLRELRVSDSEDHKPGDVLRAGLFEEGDWVDVTGTSKGKGFAGGIKRHGWRGGKASHGSMFHRGPGSIGQSSYPSRVIKGKNLPGRMGSDRVTIQGLQVVRVDPENNLLYIKGSVPGANGGLLLIRNSVKRKPKRKHK